MEKTRYWFPAKTGFGYGWGLPIRWQGWVVYALAFTGLAATFFIFPPSKNLVWFLGLQWTIILLLVLVCFLKGEPPRWNSGRKR